MTLWQTDLLVAAAKTGRIINIKKGQFCAPSVSILWTILLLTQFWMFKVLNSNCYRNTLYSKSIPTSQAMERERGSLCPSPLELSKWPMTLSTRIENLAVVWWNCLQLIHLSLTPFKSMVWNGCGLYNCFIFFLSKKSREIKKVAFSL